MAKVSFESLAPAIQSAFDTYWNRRYRTEELGERERERTARFEETKLGEQAAIDRLLAQLQAAAREGKLTREHEAALEGMRMERMTKQEDKERFEEQRNMALQQLKGIRDSAKAEIQQAQLYWDGGWEAFKNSPYGNWVSGKEQFDRINSLGGAEVKKWLTRQVIKDAYEGNRDYFEGYKIDLKGNLESLIPGYQKMPGKKIMTTEEMPEPTPGPIKKEVQRYKETFGPEGWKSDIEKLKGLGERIKDVFKKEPEEEIFPPEAPEIAPEEEEERPVVDFLKKLKFWKRR